MTTHDDQTIETLLRASLLERAEDVQATPALYERVRRQADRGAWLRRGIAVAAAAAAVAGAVTILPDLVPDQPLVPDVAETPEEAAPTEAAPGRDARLTDTLLGAGIAHAVDDGAGGSLVHVGDRVVRSDQPVVSLTTATVGGSAVVVAGLADGSIGGINVGDPGDAFDQVIEADANGAGAVPTPGADGVAWIEGRDLHVLPLVDGSVVRVLPLVGEVPDDLRIEQWVSQADAQVILASEPGGGVWSIPMDVSNVFNTAPTDPAFRLDETAVDAALLPTLERVSLQPPVDGDGPWVLATGADLRALPVDRPVGDAPTLTTNIAGGVTVVDADTGTGLLLELVDGALGPVAVSWEEPAVTAAVQVVEAVAAADASALGLPTDAPVVGTDGVSLVIRTADGTVTRRDVYPPEESEATLGLLAVRPGSTSTDGLVALESRSEGETSVRFVRLDGDGADPVGDVLVTDGEVTGLVWSDDGLAVAWTDAAGLHVAGVEGDGVVPDGAVTLFDDTRPVTDWFWTDDDGTRVSGLLAVRAGTTGTEFLGLDRFRNLQHVATEPLQGGDRLSLDTHASPGAAVGPSVSAVLTDDTVALSWGADGDQFGDLPDPGTFDGPVRVEASGGHVLVLGRDRSVLVTFDGAVVELPVATDWDVVD